MRVSLLSFQLSIENEPYEDALVDGVHVDDPQTLAPAIPVSVPRAVVRPLVNGRPVCARYLFDASALLTQRDVSGPVDLFTCTCGEPGCAGLFDDTVLEVEGPLVHWHFPEDPFRSTLGENWFTSAEPLTFTFTREQYLHALAGLTVGLVANERELGEPLALSPVEDRPTEPLLERLAAWQEDFRAGAAAMSQRLDTFGPLLGEDLVATLDSNIEIRMPAWTVALTLADHRVEPMLDGRARDTAMQEALMHDIVPSMLLSRDNVIRAARELGLIELEDWALVDFSASAVGVDLPEMEDLAEPFKQAEMRVVLR